MTATRAPEHVPLTTAQRVAAGLAILIAREPAAGLDIHSDTIFCGSFEGSPPEDRAALEALGWSYNEDSWAFST